MRAIAQTIACDVHPIDNLRVLRYLEHELAVSAEARQAWYRHWVTVGFDVVESLLRDSPDTGRFCHGDTPTVADICLASILAVMRVFKIEIDGIPTVTRIVEACEALDAFAKADPRRQAGAPQAT